MAIADNLAVVRARIAAAAQRSGRDPADVTLVAVSKTFGIEAVREAAAAGQRDFGENRVQEALQKIAKTADTPVRWHLIGHLQSNKARKAAPAFACIHSVDSLELLQKLDDGAVERPPDAPARGAGAGRSRRRGDEVRRAPRGSRSASWQPPARYARSGSPG